MFIQCVKYNLYFSVFIFVHWCTVYRAMLIENLLLLLLLFSSFFFFIVFNCMCTCVIVKWIWVCRSAPILILVLKCLENVFMPRQFSGESHQVYKEKLTLDLSNLFWKGEWALLSCCCNCLLELVFREVLSSQQDGRKTEGVLPMLSQIFELHLDWDISCAAHIVTSLWLRFQSWHWYSFLIHIL